MYIYCNALEWKSVMLVPWENPFLITIILVGGGSPKIQHRVHNHRQNTQYFCNVRVCNPEQSFRSEYIYTTDYKWMNCFKSIKITRVPLEPTIFYRVSPQALYQESPRWAKLIDYFLFAHEIFRTGSSVNKRARFLLTNESRYTSPLNFTKLLLLVLLWKLLVFALTSVVIFSWLLWLLIFQSIDTVQDASINKRATLLLGKEIESNTPVPELKQAVLAVHWGAARPE